MRRYTQLSLIMVISWGELLSTRGFHYATVSCPIRRTDIGDIGVRSCNITFDLISFVAWHDR